MNIQQAAKQITETFEASELKAVNFHLNVVSRDGDNGGIHFTDTGFVIDKEMGSDEVMRRAQRSLEVFLHHGTWKDHRGEFVLYVTECQDTSVYTLKIEPESPLSEEQEDCLSSIRNLVAEVLCK